MSSVIETVDMATPVAGHSLTRLVKGGVRVPVQVVVAGNAAAVWIGDRAVDATPELIERINIFGISISGHEFDYQVAVAKWCRIYKPNRPEAHPWEAIDLNQMDSIY